ncbi:hypothetical protein BGX28_000395 [Mortierella sp. GBA30]|nr:hypothetical protein BGX28_000395 [Mortierella sp. GBA30]
MTPAMWRVAAVVSNNDYLEHVRGCGFSTNIDIIKSIRSASNMSDDVLLASYCSKVANYRRVPNLTPARFEHAASIFCRYQEEPLEHPASSSGLDQEIANMIQDVETFRRRYKAEHRSRPPLSVTSGAYMQIEPFPRQVVVDSASSQQQVRGAQEPTESVVEAAQLSTVVETVDQQVVPHPTPEEDGPKSTRRPHQRFMSSSKFKITTFQQPEIAAVEFPVSSTSAKKKKNKKQRKRKRKTVYNPSSRRARQALSESAPQTFRMLRPSTIVDQVKAALQYNSVGNEEERETLAKTLVQLVQEPIYVSNEAMKCAQQALACYFAEVITAHPILSNADIQQRKDSFSQFSACRNNTFFTNLLHKPSTGHILLARPGSTAQR